MMGEQRKSVCGLKNRKCSACQQAASLKPRPVFVGDTDRNAVYWRRVGEEWIARIAMRRFT